MGPEYTLNARVTRTLPFSKRVRGSLMLEVFNVFDHPFTTGVNTIGYAASVGVIRPVSGVGAANAASVPRSGQIAFRIDF